MRKVSITLCVMGLLFSIVTSACAAWRPEGPVDLIVPSTPGGGHDTAARVFAKCVQDTTGVKINIINNATGGGAVAFVEVTKARPDGYTMGQLGSALVTDQYTRKDCTYTPESYRHIGIHSGDDCHLVVSTKGEFANMNLQEFLDYAKQNPVTLACSGSWGQSDNSRFLLEQAAGVKFQRVGIKGGVNCALAVVAGDVDSTMAFASEIKSQVDAGNLKILAQLGETHNDFFPDAPTFIELGYNITFPSFKTISLPKDTPDDIYEGWVEIFRQTMESSAIAEGFTNAGTTFKPIIGEKDVMAYLMKSHDIAKAILDAREKDK